MDIFDSKRKFTMKELEIIISELKEENPNLKFRTEGDGYQIGSLVILYDDKKGDIAYYQRGPDGYYHPFIG